MTAQDFLRVELPDGRAYETAGDIEWAQQSSYSYPITSPDVADAVVEDNLGGPATTRKAGVFEGAGGGTRSFNVTATVGPADSPWGDAPTDAGAIERVQRLERAIADGRHTSSNPIEVSFGEYSSAGAFEPVPAVPTEVEVRFNADDEASTARVNVEFAEALVLNTQIHVDRPGWLQEFL
jgi:hypothetical protein